MASLKKNSKGELTIAKGIRSRKSSIYTPSQNEVFKISRSRFSNFVEQKMVQMCLESASIWNGAKENI